MPTFNEDMSAFASKTAIGQIGFLEDMGQHFKRFFERASSGSLQVEINNAFEWEL
jgi:hypothetical protein